MTENQRLTAIILAALNIDENVAQIIKDEVPSVDSLDTRNSDSLDFHDVHIQALKEIARRAYVAGYTEAAKKVTEEVSKALNKNA